MKAAPRVFNSRQQTWVPYTVRAFPFLKERIVIGSDVKDPSLGHNRKVRTRFITGPRTAIQLANETW